MNTIYFDYSIRMASDIKKIDSETFKDCNYTEEEIIKKIPKDNYKIILAYEESKPVGYIGLLEVQNLHYHGIWVDLVAVIPSFQRKNVGKILMAEAEKYSKEKGITMMSGLVRISNESSIKLFKNRGYEAVESPYYLFLK